MKFKNIKDLKNENIKIVASQFFEKVNLISKMKQLKWICFKTLILSQSSECNFYWTAVLIYINFSMDVGPNSKADLFKVTCWQNLWMVIKCS